MAMAMAMTIYIARSPVASSPTRIVDYIPHRGNVNNPFPIKMKELTAGGGRARDRR
jgi:hypothetical protein